ncbi:glycosyltransferase family 2 protein [Halotia branconii]|uniref:Glycosyltransferase family 2 protein n=1 Tax=Halotia branconii CENA392 TaxID=1539056 RepID=A0AAJ6NP27_9CYAN|nr:glycosyltransferase family 2 protein [Halotia branconii]WGV24079.1 glycosyltransferase family 2 protein [Halotia branconii CENA392]
MKITCSILCYNYGRYLAQAIESCLNQQPGDYDLEVLVIDDGSTDETFEVCLNYQDRIRVLRSENQGFGASLNRGIIEASGDYVCLLDADDYFALNKLVTILPYLQQGYLYIEHLKQYVDIKGNNIENRLATGSTGTFCVNRNTALTLLPAENEIFFHPINSAGHGIHIDKVLSFYRVHESSYFRAGIWWQEKKSYERQVTKYHYLAKVTHALADRLLIMAEETSCNWAKPEMLKKISSEYRAIAYYDEMEGFLFLNKKREALLTCLKILIAAFQSQNGLTIWHIRIIFRGLMGRPIILE